MPRALRRRSEPTQQCVNGERDRAEHRNFAQRVEATKVDDDHVDDVASATAPATHVREKMAPALRPAGRVMIAKAERGDARTDCNGKRKVPRAAGARLQRLASRFVELNPPRHPSQSQQQQHRRDDFDRDLRQGQIGRREPSEGQAGHQAGPPTMISAASR